MKTKYDVGLGTKNFYVFVSGQKTAIAKKSSSSLTNPKQVNNWAKKEYLKYLKQKMKSKK